MLLLSMFFFLAIGIPIPISMGLSCLLTIVSFHEVPVIFLAQGMYDSLVSFPILAIPFFVFAGLIMSESGMSRVLVELARKIIGGTRGGLINVGILACVFFAGISGSSVADTVAITSILMPELVRIGYKKSYAAAALACGGITGPVVPPSLGLLVFGVITGTSIVKLFIAGIIPGSLMGLSLMVANYFRCRGMGFREEGKRGSLKEMMIALNDAKWAVLTPFIILGGIYGGVFTPTEAGAVTFFYGIIVGLFIYRGITFKDLPRLFTEGCTISVAILLIVGFSGAYGRLLTVEQIPQKLTALLFAISSNKYFVLLLVNILLLLIGCVMEGLAATLVFANLLLGVVKAVGVDPVHFGIIMGVNIAIGAVTPPVGVCLFASSAVTGVPFERIARETLPFLVSLIVVLCLVTYIPDISMFLVKQLF